MSQPMTREAGPFRGLYPRRRRAAGRKGGVPPRKRWRRSAPETSDHIRGPPSSERQRILSHPGGGDRVAGSSGERVGAIRSGATPPDGSAALTPLKGEVIASRWSPVCPPPNARDLAT